ncbi:hypothetical protein SETIT_9G153700v2 [Setaria italica]|uniref:Uncharacterized protein n=1 Tax=Setaria italica TaxID=4555 RepID=A0A368SGX7_SETIT|nr:hypothetical protein SETIT_9G153700v2 [Setaria italica]
MVQNSNVFVLDYSQINSAPRIFSKISSPQMRLPFQTWIPNQISKIINCSNQRQCQWGWPARRATEQSSSCQVLCFLQPQLLSPARFMGLGWVKENHSGAGATCVLAASFPYFFQASRLRVTTVNDMEVSSNPFFPGRMLHPLESGRTCFCLRWLIQSPRGIY